MTVLVAFPPRHWTYIAASTSRWSVCQKCAVSSLALQTRQVQGLALSSAEFLALQCVSNTMLLCIPCGKWGKVKHLKMPFLHTWECVAILKYLTVALDKLCSMMCWWMDQWCHLKHYFKVLLECNCASIHSSCRLRNNFKLRRECPLDKAGMAQKCRQEQIFPGNLFFYLFHSYTTHLATRPLCYASTNEAKWRILFPQSFYVPVIYIFIGFGLYMISLLLYKQYKKASYHD